MNILTLSGLLLPLLQATPLHRPPDHTHFSTIAIQTEPTDENEMDVASEVGVVSDVGVASLEGRMLSFQRELESRNKRLMEGEVSDLIGPMVTMVPRVLS